MGHFGGIGYIQVFEEELPKWAGKGEWELDDENYLFGDCFLEVLDKNEETVGLFFMLQRFTGKPDCRDGLQFAHYYDQLVIDNDDSFWLMEESRWEVKKDLYRTSDIEVIKSIELAEDWTDLSREFDMVTTRALISYGRIKYPYGLEEPAKDIYESELNCFNIDSNLYDEPLCKVIDFLIELFGVDELYKNGCHEQISDLEMEYYGDNADRLLTNTNIDFFIEAANKNKKTDVLAFLLDYKNKHFPEKRNELPELQG